MKLCIYRTGITKWCFLGQYQHGQKAARIWQVLPVLTRVFNEYARKQDSQRQAMILLSRRRCKREGYYSHCFCQADSSGQFEGQTKTKLGVILEMRGFVETTTSGKSGMAFLEENPAQAKYYFRNVLRAS